MTSPCTPSRMHSFAGHVLYHLARHTYFIDVTWACSQTERGEGPRAVWWGVSVDHAACRRPCWRHVSALGLGEGNGTSAVESSRAGECEHTRRSARLPVPELAVKVAFVTRADRETRRSGLGGGRLARWPNLDGYRRRCRWPRRLAGRWEGLCHFGPRRIVVEVPRLSGFVAMSSAGIRGYSIYVRHAPCMGSPVSLTLLHCGNRSLRRLCLYSVFFLMIT
jgi:hypothetical protein